MSTITFDFRHHYVRGERRESEQIAYQWDLGHVMNVFVPEDATYTIGYCFGDYEKTEDYAIDTKVQDPDGGYKLTAHIPNKYFERSRELRVYVVGSADDHIITTYEGFITIRGRLQPDDYVDDDPENGATQIIEVAREYATKSESFAVGGTGTRLGEDTDNAKYYLEQAEAVAESIPEDYSELSDDVSQLKNALIVSNAEGAIASFPDGGDGFAVRDLSVQMEPIQDLHGYDNPWTAGGGKNLFGGEYGVKWLLPTPLSVSSGDSFTVSTSVPASSNPRINVFTGEGGATRYYNAGINDTVNNRKVKIFTFSEDVTITGFMVDYAECTDIQIERGSTATAYTPYSNVCPISGRSEVTVTRCGKNLFNPDDVNDGYIDSLGHIVTPANPWVYEYIKISGGSTYTISGCTENNSPSHVWYDKNMTFISYFSKHVNGTYAAPANAEYMGICAIKMDNTSHDIDTMQVEVGSTATPYEAYNPQTVEIPLGQTAYGGTLDVTNGTLTVDRVYAEYSGDFTLTTGANNYFAKSVGAYGSVVAGEIISDQYPQVTIALSNTNKGIDIVNSGTRNDARILIRPYNMTQEMTANDFNAVLSETPLHVCYKVTSPVTVQLTAQQLTTLLGQNNVWSDAESVAVDYVADTKLYIEQLTEPDADMVADMNITSGKYFMVGNSLYLATANIANGAAITVGVNCTRTSLAEALNAINA